MLLLYFTGELLKIRRWVLLSCMFAVVSAPVVTYHTAIVSNDSTVLFYAALMAFIAALTHVRQKPYVWFALIAALLAGFTKSTIVTAIFATGGARGEERVKMTRMRQTIAKRLKSAQDNAALLTTFNDVDVSAVIEARDKYKDLFAKKHDIRLGFMGFFAKAACLALKDVPAVNAYIDGDEIIYHDYVDISVAVSAPNGLVVPVIRDADKKGFARIEQDIADFGARAKAGTLTMEDMTGGTFTISNGGVFGSLMSTPIINPPQSAVLGLHRIEDRPVVRNGQIVIRPMMYLALSYDHRLIDGREAVTALKIIKDAIEDPTRMLIDL
jgi:2-oxoglutarate dehydrogenase E2 component (dihydrolipoamide succinyltransferase)